MDDIIKNTLSKIIKETTNKINAIQPTPLKQLVSFAAYDGNGYSKDAIPDFNDLSDEEIEKLYVMAGSSKNNLK